MTEEWRPVVGHEGKYEVSSLGRVRSLPRPRTRGGVLRPQGSGYPHFSFWSNGKHLTIRLHVLVAEAFIGPRPPGQVVRHLNGDGWDCRATNIEWGTYSENLMDQLAHGTHPTASRTHCPAGHAYDEQNTRVAVRSDGAQARYCRACDRARPSRQRTRDRVEL